MGKRGWRFLVLLIVTAALVILAAVFWPWLRQWLPHPALIESWLEYLVVDLNVGQWGPVATLLLVGVIELVWALSLGRRSGEFDRQLRRLDRVHAREVEVLTQEVATLKEERRALLSELDLLDGLIREEKARLWAQFEDLQRATGLHVHGLGEGDTGGGAMPRRLIAVDVADLPPGLKGEWRQVISQLERIEMVSSVTIRQGQNARGQQHADELLRLGSACYQLGQHERALAHYSKAAELAPGDPSVLINRAVVNQALGRDKLALQDLERALKLEESPWAYLYRGLLRERLGEDRRALEDYARAIRLDPGLSEGHFRCGLLHTRAKEHDKAIQDQSRVLELDSNHAGALTARGVARAATGDLQAALEDLDRACALAPSRYEAFYHRGRVRCQMQRYQEALADLTSVVELAPGFAPVFMARGDAFLALGENWQAVTNYGQAIELEPNNAAAHHARGVARMAMREYQRAIEDFGQALELDPGMARALADRGSASEKLGEHDLAIRDLDRAIALDPGLAIAYYNRGLAYGHKGEYDRASRDLNKAVELDPSLSIKKGAAGPEST